MNKYGNLLKIISEDLNIPQGEHEHETDWKNRIIYSAIGHLANASLYDKQEDGLAISIHHFKRKIEKLYDSYLSMYPEVTNLFLGNPEKLSETIYELFHKTGYLYHSPNHLAPPVRSVSVYKDVTFLRGVLPDKKVFRSGLGPYIINDYIIKGKDIRAMFGLSDKTFLESWKHSIGSIEWKQVNLTGKAEFLRIEPPFNKGYFKSSPDKDGRISMLRAGMPGMYLYYFYRYVNGKMETRQIPAWQTDYFEYRNIANSILYNAQTLPPTIYHVDKNIVRLKIQYLYPPAEQDFLLLYSWPSGVIDNIFNRVMACPVFYAVKDIFEKSGYCFLEE